MSARGWEVSGLATLHVKICCAYIRNLTICNKLVSMNQKRDKPVGIAMVDSGSNINLTSMRNDFQHIDSTPTVNISGVNGE